MCAELFGGAVIESDRNYLKAQDYFTHIIDATQTQPHPLYCGGKHCRCDLSYEVC